MKSSLPLAANSVDAPDLGDMDVGAVPEDHSAQVVRDAAQACADPYYHIRRMQLRWSTNVVHVPFVREEEVHSIERVHGVDEALPRLCRALQRLTRVSAPCHLVACLNVIITDLVWGCPPESLLTLMEVTLQMIPDPATQLAAWSYPHNTPEKEDLKRQLVTTWIWEHCLARSGKADEATALRAAQRRSTKRPPAAIRHDEPIPWAFACSDTGGCSPLSSVQVSKAGSVRLCGPQASVVSGAVRALTAAEASVDFSLCQIASGRDCVSTAELLDFKELAPRNRRKLLEEGAGPYYDSTCTALTTLKWVVKRPPKGVWAASTFRPSLHAPCRSVLRMTVTHKDGHVEAIDVTESSPFLSVTRNMKSFLMGQAERGKLCAPQDCLAPNILDRYAFVVEQIESRTRALEGLTPLDDDACLQLLRRPQPVQEHAGNMRISVPISLKRRRDEEYVGA
jgi:hypothetical protein